ncbi:ABC transporter permease [Pandoraea iniqua]|uniref:ABC transporter permease n=2 Tax=Pandoraea iniqua TaxID=2508288 RepID=A0A5E4Z0K8_9BURK|nr:ABC transporter permease [Pandoraea iniqua]
MKIKPWLLALGLGAGFGMTSVGSMAQLPDRPVKVGVLTDMSGTYSAMGGAGSVVAAQMAIDDCLAAECKGMKIDLVSADNQNKADVAANKAREWFDRDNVDAVADLTNSAAALAVQKIAMDKQRIALFSGPATTRLTNEDCSPTGFHWMFDTYSQSAATARAMVKNGGKTWYFITVDYAFGHSLEKDAADNVKALGGTVVGQSRHPLNASDYASFLLSAQSSKAEVVALANGGQDTVNALKQAREFGIVQRGQKLAALLVFLSDVHALGLNTAQGLMFTDGFYWDFDDASRTWSARFQKKYKDLKPTMVQAGVYSSVLHYLRAVAATKSVDAKVVAQKMREMPIRDPIMHNASIRPDGRVIHDMYLFRVKAPSESKGPWDYYSTVATVPATEAFQPLSKSTCPLVKTTAAAR